MVERDPPSFGQMHFPGGAPTKTFFGVEPSGKSFEIMTIDIHTVENGRITKSYHVEEWAKAIQQLSAK